MDFHFILLLVHLSLLYPSSCEDLQKTTIPYSGGCSKNVCNNNITIKNECLDLIVFNIDSQKCQPDDKTNCNNSIITTQLKNSSDMSEVILRNQCLPNNIWLERDPKDCRQYYACIFGIMLHMKCLYGLEFSSTQHICVDKEKSDCKVTTIPASTTSPTTELNPYYICHSYDTWIKPDIQDCRRYYKCRFGTLQHATCTFNYEFSQKWRICVPKQKSDCTLSPTTILSTTSSTTLTTISPSTVVTIKPNAQCNLHDVWIQSDLEDCRRYYVCAFGVFTPMMCQLNYEFNAKLKICVNKEKSGCNITVTSSPTNPSIATHKTTTTNKPTTAQITTTSLKPQFKCDSRDIWILSDVEDCSRYYVCAFGVFTHMTCKLNYEFDAKLKMCVAKEKSDCKVTTIPASTTSPTTELNPYYICRSYDTWIKPDIQDCRRYYKCRFGTLQHATCTFNYEFSQKWRICVPKQKSDCTLSPTTILSTTSSTTLTTISPSTVVTIKPNVQCNLHDVWIQSDLEDCRRYYVCAFGVFTHMTCQLNYEFNAKLKICVNKEKSGCNITVTSSPTNPSITTHKTTTTNKPTTAQITTTSSKPQFKCDLLDIWILSDVEDCSRYYVCAFGVFTHMTCKLNYEFDAKLKICVDKEKSDCKVTTIPASTTSPTTELNPYYICRSYDTWIKPDIQDCRRYYKCRFGTLQHATCTFNYEFSQKWRICVPKQKSDCTLSPTTILSTTSSTTLTTISPSTVVTIKPNAQCNLHDVWIQSDLEDCRRYYVCAFGVFTHMTCQLNYEFNANLKICVNKEKSGCNITVTSSPTNPSITTHKTTTNNKPTTAQITTTSLKPQFKCDLLDVWILSDVEDCRRYYICAFGVFTHMTCQLNYEFNAKLKMCVNKEKSGCNITETSSPTNPSITTHKTTTTNKPTTTQITTTSLKPQFKCDSLDVWILSDVEDCRRYYICAFGVFTHMTCQLDYEFNAKLKICINKEKSGCNITVTSRPTNPSTTTHKTITTNKPTITQIITTSLKPQFKCDLLDVWILSDAEDCRRYYICAFGTFTHMTCQLNYEFNAKLKICVSKEKSGCSITVTSSPTIPSISTHKTTTTNKPTTAQITTTSLKPQFKCDLLDVWILSDVEDCSRYYICAFGVFTHMKCQLNYEFNAKLKICVNKEKSSCNVTVTSSPANLSTTTYKTTTTNKQTTLKPQFKCDLLDVWMLSDVEDCRRYYVCAFGTIHHSTCPLDYEFSSKLRDCVEKEYSNCNVYTAKEANNIILSNTANTNKTSIIIPTAYNIFTSINASTATKKASDTIINRIKQVDGLPRMSNALTNIYKKPTSIHEGPTAINEGPTTINEGPIANYEGPITIHEEPTSVNTQIQNPHYECDVDNEWLDPDVQDCRSYYICTFGLITHATCPMNYEFSPTLRKCVDKAIANCLPNNFNARRSEIAFGKDHLESYSLSTNKCKLKSILVYFEPDEEDPKKYYACINGKARRMDCPNGYIFNVIDLKCIEAKEGCSLKGDKM